MEVEDLSPYQITWIEFRVIKGVVTRKDCKTLLQNTPIPDRAPWANCIYPHFLDKEHAEAHLASIDRSKLSKHYEARLFADKQFGMERGEDGQIPFTDLQNKQMVLL